MIITLGLLSGLLTTCAWLPQLLRTWRRGRADDISYTYLGVFAAGVLGWLAYGLVAEQPAVFAANVVTFTLIVALALLKTRPRSRINQATNPANAPRPYLRLEKQSVTVSSPGDRNRQAEAPELSSRLTGEVRKCR